MTKDFDDQYPRLNIRLSAELRARTTRAADRAGVGVAAWIRDAITQRLDRDEHVPEHSGDTDVDNH